MVEPSNVSMISNESLRYDRFALTMFMSPWSITFACGNIWDSYLNADASAADPWGRSEVVIGVARREAYRNKEVVKRKLLGVDWEDVVAAFLFIRACVEVLNSQFQIYIHIDIELRY